MYYVDPKMGNYTVASLKKKKVQKINYNGHRNTNQSMYNKQPNHICTRLSAMNLLIYIFLLFS